MPYYDFTCKKCSVNFEEFMPMNSVQTSENKVEQNELPPCPTCKSKKNVGRLISGAALHGVN